VVTGSDVGARFKRMQGYDVFFPIGFDAFRSARRERRRSAPAPTRAATRTTNIVKMRRQLRSMGCMFDWSRSSSPATREYYAWNQWFFLKFFEQGWLIASSHRWIGARPANTTLAASR